MAGLARRTVKKSASEVVARMDWGRLPPQRESPAADHGHRFENIVLRPPVEVIRRGNREAFDSGKCGRGRDVKHGHNGIRIRKRKRLQQDRIHNAKDSSVRANPQGQHGERRKGEGGFLRSTRIACAAGARRSRMPSRKARSAPAVNVYYSGFYIFPKVGQCSGLARSCSEREQVRSPTTGPTCRTSEHAFSPNYPPRTISFCVQPHTPI